MKSQGLPLQTIVLVVIALIALSAIGVFFFASFKKGGESADVGYCQQLCSQLQSMHAGNPGMDLNDLRNTPIGNKFCTEECYNKITCNIEGLGTLTC